MSRASRSNVYRLWVAFGVVAILLGWSAHLTGQSPRQIKVLLESQQLVDQNRQAV